MDKDKLKLALRLELARRSFWEYCKLTANDFYREDREYLKDLCHTLQDFLTSEDTVLIINMPPRHGKSRTLGKFAEWLLGTNPETKVMTASYNETLSTTFSKNVRNTIQEIKADPNRLVYSDIFPTTKIKKGDGAMNLWALEGGYSNYLATSPGGTATGFGASLLIIDDVIKSAEEAYNARVLEGHWEWFNNTMLSRLEENGKCIICMTRWGTKDLAGRMLKFTEENEIPYKHINYRAHTDGKMLCDEILSLKTYKLKTAGMKQDIVEANYNQEPIDVKGRLYSSFATYSEIPKGKRCCYVDTADTGSDYLCAIAYVEHDKEAYILDILYTQEPMQITEGKLAKMLYDNDINICTIESNNGGLGFARNVGNLLKTVHNSNKCIIKTFHQSHNKLTRILTNASWIEQHIYYPYNWENKYKDYYIAMATYQREGKNKHDDAPDCTTGIAEQLGQGRGGIGSWNISNFGF